MEQKWLNLNKNPNFRGMLNADLMYIDRHPDQPTGNQQNNDFDQKVQIAIWYNDRLFHRLSYLGLILILAAQARKYISVPYSVPY